MEVARLDEIMESVRTVYGSLRSPDFSSVRAHDHDNPMRQLQQCLTGTEVIDDTDPDTDVCFSFLIRRQGQERFLQLSLVGPYACVRVIGKPDRYLSLAHPVAGLDLEILDCLARSGLKLVEQDVLIQPIRGFQLFYTDPHDVAVYHALFSDTGRPVLEADDPEGL